MHSLIFFVFFLPACQDEKTTTEEISIVWKQDEATGISVPRKLIDTNPDSVSRLLQVRLQAAQQGNMLGDYEVTRDAIFFKPLLPLSRGYTYQVFFRNKQVATLTVPKDKNGLPAAVAAIYPSIQMVPENLLKFYIVFSSEMREGQSLKHIHLLNEKMDTLPAVFLELQPELWNQQRTALTLWLDPGRIKRDLIPNQQMGNPLEKGKWYTLVISKNFPDVKGNTLAKDYTRRFNVQHRDSLVPDLAQWIISTPPAHSSSALEIQTNEPLDYFLLKETITVYDSQGKEVKGKLRVGKGESSIFVFPDQQWMEGEYRLVVKPILEDLAGNNLDRPFDRDMARPVKKPKPVYSRSFNIAAVKASDKAD
jgi:hypothetical protein